MADHIILGSEALGEPVLPPIEIEEYLNDTWIDSTFPASQTTIKADSDFRIKFKRPIDLTVLSLDNFEIDRVITEDPLTVTELSDVFEEINSVNDYNSLSRELILHQKSNISYLATFFLIIKNLVDTTGTVQVDSHIILFQTAVGADTLDVDTQPDIDEIIVEDYTLADPPLPVSYGGSLVTSSISDGSVNVTSSDGVITLTFSSGPDVDLIYVSREDLDTGDVELLEVTNELDEDGLTVTVQLPNIGDEEDPEYLVQNSIYRIDAIYTTFEFTSTLDPFYVPLIHFRPFTTAPTSDPIGWATLVYMISKEVYEMMGDSAETWISEKAEAVRSYTKYLILSMMESTSSNESFMLGELQLSSGAKSGINYKDQLLAWEDKLFTRGRIVQTFDPFWPRPGRSMHDKHKSQLSREWTTFDRRLD